MIEDRVKELGSRNKEEPRKMKDSGVEWIGEIPEDWKVYRGKVILTKLERPVLESDDVVTCFRDGEVTLRSNRRVDGFTMADKEIGYQGIEPNDLVVHGMDGFAGAIGISDSRGKGSPVLNVLDTRQNKKYLMYYMRNMAYNDVFTSIATGIRVRSCDLRWNKIADLPFPLPPKKEQAKIVDFIDTKTTLIDNIIEKTKQSIEDYKKYKQSLITETVTKGLNPDVEMKDSGIEWIDRIPGHWEIKMLKYVTKLNQKCLSENTDEDYVFRYVDIGSVSLENGIERYEKMRFRDAPSRARRVVANGDVIISTVRTYLKAITNIRDDSDIIVSTGFAVLTPFQVYAKYLEFFCKCDYFAETVSAHSYGVSYPAINASDILKFKITLPPIEEQQQIADYLDRKCLQIDKIIDQKETLINELEIYKKSLIYECVTGKRYVG